MKKLFALMLALCLLGSVAMADNTLVWEGEVETVASQFGGEFVTMKEIAVKLWIPAGYEAVELSDEDKEAGYIAYFEGADGAFAVMYVNMDGMSLDEYKAELEGTDGVTEVEPGTVNGLPCLGYKCTANDSTNGVLAFKRFA